MDIRMEKTEKAIKNAFMELRSKKPLEKITVKELCSLACMETETVASVLKSIPHAQEYSFENLNVVARELCLAFVSHISLINVLFSDKGHSYLAEKLEKEIKKTVFEKYPQYKEDAEKNILLSYCIQGSYYAYWNNQDVDVETLLQVIENIVKLLQTLY